MQFQSGINENIWTTSLVLRVGGKRSSTDPNKLGLVSKQWKWTDYSLWWMTKST